MRILFINNHCLSDPTAGVTQSFRTILRWWKEAGHAVYALTTATFESPVPWTIADHLAAVPSAQLRADGTTAYALDGVKVVVFPTVATQVAAMTTALTELYPDVLVVQGSHPYMNSWLAAAKTRGITTVRTVRSYRYYHDSFYRDVDHVFTCSAYLADHYQQKINRSFTVLPPPLDWSTVSASHHDPKYVTFIQPRKHKGWNAIVRLGQMLAERRPDIPPIRVVCSSYGVGDPQPAGGAPLGIEFVPPVPAPALWASWTKVLLVPSVWDEPWGRVAAEAMVNGIPPIVSDRGALPEVVGSAGLVRPLPEWLLPASGRLPTADEMESWYQTIITLWDDPMVYAIASEAARAWGVQTFSEDRSRLRYTDYLRSLRPDLPPDLT